MTVFLMAGLMYIFLEIVLELQISKELKFLLSLTILLEWQLYMYLCILSVRYVLLYTLVRQKKRYLLLCSMIVNHSFSVIS